MWVWGAVTHTQATSHQVYIGLSVSTTAHDSSSYLILMKCFSFLYYCVKWWEITRCFVIIAVTSTNISKCKPFLTGRNTIYHSWHEPSSHGCTPDTALYANITTVFSLINCLPISSQLSSAVCSCTMKVLSLMTYSCFLSHLDQISKYIDLLSLFKIVSEKLQAAYCNHCLQALL